jgi:hypothetical protein
MTPFTPSDLRALAQVRDPQPVCVTLTMPTHRSGAQTRQDPIRFQNLLDEAAAALAQHGQSEPFIEQHLRPARALLDDPQFWRNLGEGLALFIGPDFMRIHHAAAALPQRVTVAGWFHVTDMLGAAAEDGRFWILAASPGRVRLLEASRWTAREVEVPNMPRDISQVMQYVDQEKQLQWHSGTATQTPGGRRAGVFHGHGAGSDEGQKKLRDEEFVRLVDAAAGAVLGGADDPVVLMATEPFSSIFLQTARQVTVAGVSEGNADHLGESELRDRAWPVAQLVIGVERETAAAHWAESSTAGRLDDVGQVLAAAETGRIRTLLVRVGSRWEGRFDAATGRAERLEAGEAEAEDLINRAVIETVTRKGTVYGLEAELMPTQEPMAALLRY